jgi:tetratricopeptide (TPR) repeat protein
MRSRKVIWPAALLLLASTGVASPQEDFAMANGHFQAGRYEAALKIYQAIDGRLAHWKVLYNIGNCYAKLGRPLDAKIHYLRARKYRPLDRSIAKNIALVNKRFADVLAPETPDFLSRAIQVLQASFSVNLLGLLLLLAVLLLNVFLFLLLAKGRKKKILYGLSFSLLLSLALGTWLFTRVSALEQTTTAVVRKADAVLRSGPGASNTELFKVHAGLEVKILERRREWVQVTASPQVAGWVELEDLTLI